MNKYFHKENYFDCKGFTLLELIIVVGIFFLVAGVTLAYGNFYSSSLLDDAAAQITQNIRFAQQKSIAGYNNSSHGIYFDINPLGDDRVIVYTGDSYSTRDSDFDRIYELQSSMQLSTNIIGNEINFSKGSGIPDKVGDILINHMANGNRQISINNLGVIKNIKF